MRNLKLIPLLLFLFTTQNFYSQESHLEDKKIDAFLNNITGEEFSGAILMAKGDNIIQKRAYGLASKELDVKNKIDTKFNIASITKTFTAVAILQLYEEGKIDLETPIGKYLKEYPNEEVRNSVTISQLLTHTAGLPNFYVTNFLDKCKFDLKEVNDFVPLFVNDTLLSEPGTSYNYDAAGYVVLGLIIEEVTGSNYYDYLKENIFQKAGMPNTLAFDVDSIIENKASGYTFVSDTSQVLKIIFFIYQKLPPVVFIIPLSKIYSISTKHFSTTI